MRVKDIKGGFRFTQRYQYRVIYSGGDYFSPEPRDATLKEAVEEPALLVR
ncbi:hypothetical protein [Butyrivibrio sp. XPD2002]|nr:hypothetical protein [Butyrivibrio sp. XPD2002]